MLKNNKWKLILSAILILLPILFGLLLWDQLPDTMITHWGADGSADGTMKKGVAIFVLPLVFLALHLFALIVTSLDKSQKPQNKKALGIIFWIIPGVSLFVTGIFYAIALEKTKNLHLLLPLIMGLMFLIIGNYMPKISQNRTLGIKIYWTLHNEENWNKTHRLAGKLWVICGFLLFLCALLPTNWMLGTAVAVLLVAVAVPFLYSYCLYKKHQKAGISYDAPAKSKKDKIIGIICTIVVSLILVFVGFIMLTGDITCTCTDTSLSITADFSEDIAVSYDSIDEISYMEEKTPAMRVYGFGSPRLRMGTFESDDLGRHTRYTYTDCKSVIVLTSGNKTLVINCQTPEETESLYQTLLEKTK